MAVALHFFAEPFVEREGERLRFPLRKAEAILFYLALEGRVSRRRLSFLFWGDKDDALASNSLRNTLHVLRKSLPGHFKVERHFVSLENLGRDLDAIPRMARPKEALDPAFLSEPLQGLDMLGSPEFDAWLALARGSIRRKVVEALGLRVKTCYEEDLPDDLTESLSALLAIDPFDENSVLELMEAWRNQGYIAKAVSLYNNFSKKIRAELGIAPSERAETFFATFLAAEKKADVPGGFFCCRETEVEKLLRFMIESGTRLAFVHGEAGIGKTTLVERVVQLLSAKSADVLTLRPCSIGEKYPYSSWFEVVSQIGRRLKERRLPVDPTTLSLLSSVFHGFARSCGVPRVADASQAPTFFTVGKLLAELVENLSQETPPFFIFEDLHWFDPPSLQLLQAFLSQIDMPFAALFTSRPESADSVSSLLSSLTTVFPSNFMQLPLMPFNDKETMRFCRKFLPEALVANKGDDYFIKGSEGIPLLLVEMLRTLSDNPDADPSAGLKRLILGRLEEIPPPERRLLEALSAFGCGSSIEDVASFMHASVRDLLEPMDGLLRKRWIRECLDDEFLVDFCHANIRECVYDSIPGFKRREFHRRIAEILSSRASPQRWNPGLSSMLCHHYRMAGLQRRELHQHLSEMSFHIALNHTLFPLLQDQVLLSCSLPFGTREDTEFKIEQVRGLLQTSEEGPESPEGFRLEASFLELGGGYQINWGNYREGRTLINRSLKLAERHGFDEIRLHCLEHMGHSFLQTDESPRLLAAGREILQLAQKLDKAQHMGLALRFIGMHHLIEKNFEEAERIFLHSIRLFEELALMGKSYSLSLLAPRCYIGELCQWTGRPDLAMEHFTFCIERCSDVGLFWGLSHFHAHAADTALDLGDWELVHKHIDEAATLLESCRGGHCGSILYSLKAIGEVRRNRPKEALVSLKKADMLSAIGKKSWRAPQLMAKAWIARAVEEGQWDGTPFVGCLDRASADYARNAAALYEGIGARNRAGWVRDKFLPR